MTKLLSLKVAIYCSLFQVSFNYKTFFFSEFMAMLDRSIVKNPYSDDLTKPNNELNRLEHNLLKPAIPFLRIGHCTRGRYLRLQGQLIMISADVVSSMEKILPIRQNLIPVSFKRKIEYKGYYIREYIDRDKVEEYFKFLIVNNHLFQGYNLSNLKEFEGKMSALDDNTTDNVDGDIYEENDSTSESIQIPMGHSSLILDKYKESTQALTVANKLAGMIHEFERLKEEIEEDEEETLNDPEENFYSEDEITDYEEESELMGKLYEIDVKIEDKENMTIISELEYILLTWKKKLDLNLAEHFCSLVKMEAHLLTQKDKLIRMKSNIVELQDLIDSILRDVNENINTTKEKRLKAVKCSHVNQSNESARLLGDIQKCKTNTNEETRKFVSNQVNQIKKNLKSIVDVAPGERGKFLQWGPDIYLEEKLFPQLFPYGIGGYLSSNLLKSSNMGFSNYVKNRILSVQSKFHRDPDYIFFLLIVKEQLEMRRSERTFFRKAAKLPALTPKVIASQPAEMFMRYNTAYHQFKNIRGYKFYYQDVHKRLMAFIRQKGGPTLFATFSAAEFAWDHLALRIYETVTKRPSTMEFIKNQSVSWRNKLIQENVVQTTLHFNKRMDKIISYLNSAPLLEYDGVQYSVSSYFYRIEFQV